DWEALVGLRTLWVYYEWLDPPPATATRSSLGLRPDATVFWCGQSLYKYLPRYDDVFPRVAQAVPGCQFVFVVHPQGEPATEPFRRRLEPVFVTDGLPAAASSA